MVSIKKHNIYLDTTDLLKNPKDDYPILYKHLINNEPLKVLDLGCNIPLALFLLYHSFECDILKGVDEKDQMNCVNYFLNFKKRVDPLVMHKYSNANCFFDIYLRMIEVSDFEKPKITERDEFDKIFCNSFVQEDIENHLNGETEKYDLIIASDVLHVFTKNKVQTVLPKIKSHIRENGLILIRFHDENNSDHIDYESFKKLLLQEFNSGDLFEYSKDSKWQHSIFCNISNLIDSQ